MNFKPQTEAIETACKLVPLLPSHTVWALSVTEDDEYRSRPSTLNIFADPWEWPMLARSLSLGTCTDIHDEFLTYRVGHLVISLIEKEIVS